MACFLPASSTCCWCSSYHSAAMHRNVHRSSADSSSLLLVLLLLMHSISSSMADPNAYNEGTIPAAAAHTTAEGLDGVFQSPDTSDEYQETTKKLLDAVDFLRAHFGYKDMKLDLPNIVVCGIQSSGKSSVMEAISQVPFPRKSGKCTACPIEVQLRDNNKPRAYSIYLKHHQPDHAAEASGLETHKVLRTSEFTGSEHQLLQKVRQEITEAQKKLLSKGGANGATVGFTKSSIIVKVDGAATNLTLVDLPGIITHDDKLMSDQKSLPTDLVKEYVQRRNTIVVAVVMCTTDINNQGVFELIREHKGASYKDTLAVLTHPDRVQTSDERVWAEIFNGNNGTQPEHGYYIVRNPGPKDEHVSFEEARRLEQEYFVSEQFTARWPLDARLGDRLGAKALRKRLSQLLMNMILAQKPALLQAMKDLQDDVSTRKKALPRILNETEAEHEYLLQVMKLNNQLENMAHSFSHHKGTLDYWNHLREQYETFGDKVRDTQPKFVVEALSNGDSKPLVVYCKDTPQLHNKPYNIVAGGTPDPSVFTTEQIKKIVERSTGANLEGVKSDRPIWNIVQECQKSWKELARDAARRAAKTTLEFVEVKIKEHFAEFPAAEAYVRKTITTQVHEKMENLVLETVQRIAENEFKQQWVCNRQYDKSITQDCVANLTETFAEALVLRNGKKGKVGEKSGGTKEEILEELKKARHPNTQDPSNKESYLLPETIEWTARAMTYMNQASIRFADSVAVAITGYLVLPYPEEVGKAIMATPQMRSRVNIHELMQADPAAAKEAFELQKQSDLLQQQQDKLAMGK